MWSAVRRALKESATREIGNVLAALSLIYALCDAFSKRGQVPRGVIAGILFGLVLWLGFGAHSFWIQVRFFHWRHVPFFALIGQKEDYKKTLLTVIQTRMRQLGFDESFALKHFHVERDDWIYHRSDIPGADERQWKELLRDLDLRFRGLVTRFPSDTTFHLFLNMPLALGVGFGAKLGTRFRVVLHNESTIDRGLQFSQVIDLSSPHSLGTEGLHLAKTEVTDALQYVKQSGATTLNTQILLSTDLGSHSGKADVEEFAKRQGKPAVHIEATYGSTLKASDDWLRVHRETWTLINRILSSGQVKQIDLFPISPLPLAVVLGMALGPYDDIRVYRFIEKQQEYHVALRLKSLD
jgi:hypothetical protein